jgi:DNA-binding transcriptional LysR family regulator
MAFDSRLLSGIGVLAAVVEAGSFVRAGEAIGITQSGVSRSVSRLEQRIGIKLFHRTARSISLTEEGRHFTNRSRLIFLTSRTRPSKRRARRAS